MTVAAAFCPLSLQTILDGNGRPIVGARLTFYDAGTTALRQSYLDAALTTAATSPVLTDGFGRAPAVFLGIGAYKVVLQDAQGAGLSVVDGLPGAVDSGPVTPSTSTVIPPGATMAMHRSDNIAGWVIANGKTIGDETSGASARADPDTQALFSVLWNEDATLAVTGGRGTSALTDFNAGKAMALPDYRGRTVVGRDGMGNGLSSRLLEAFGANANKVGATAGVDVVTLDNTMIPAHSHNVTVTPAGGHTPSGTMDSQGAHSHTGTTDTAADHTHNYTKPSTSGSAAMGPDVIGFTTGINATAPAGSHAHNISTNTVGAHAHNLTMAAVPNHTHTATADSYGAGASHPNMQPSILGTVYLKL